MRQLVAAERAADVEALRLVAAKVRKERTRDRIFDPFGDDP
jgi:uncharacterized protein YoaH (UPF0181 family)